MTEASPYTRLGQALLGGDTRYEAAERAGLTDGLQQRKLASEISFLDARTQQALLAARADRDRRNAMTQLGEAVVSMGVPAAAAPLLQSGAASYADLADHRESRVAAEREQADRAAVARALESAGFSPQLSSIVRSGADYENLMQSRLTGQQAEQQAEREQADRAAVARALESAGLSPQLSSIVRSGADFENLMQSRLAGQQAGREQATEAADPKPLSEYVLPGGVGVRTLSDDINWRSAFGAGSQILQGSNAVLDWFGMGAPAQNTAAAVQELKELAANTVIALRENLRDRPPATIIQQLEKYKEDPLPWLRGEELARKNFLTTHRYVKREMEDARRMLDSPTEKTPTRSGRLEDRYRRLAHLYANYDFLKQKMDEADALNAQPDEDGWVTGNGYRYRMMPE